MAYNPGDEYLQQPPGVPGQAWNPDNMAAAAAQQFNQQGAQPPTATSGPKRRNPHRPSNEMGGVQTFGGKTWIRDGSWWVDKDVVDANGGNVDAMDPALVEASRIPYREGVIKMRQEGVNAWNDQNWGQDWRSLRREMLQNAKAKGLSDDEIEYLWKAGPNIWREQGLIGGGTPQTPTVPPPPTGTDRPDPNANYRPTRPQGPIFSPTTNRPQAPPMTRPRPMDVPPPPVMGGGGGMKPPDFQNGFPSGAGMDTSWMKPFQQGSQRTGGQMWSGMNKTLKGFGK